MNYLIDADPKKRYDVNERVLLSELNTLADMIGDDFPLVKGVVPMPKGGRPSSVVQALAGLADRFNAHTNYIVANALSKDGKECLASRYAVGRETNHPPS